MRADDCYVCDSGLRTFYEGYRLFFSINPLTGTSEQ